MFPHARFRAWATRWLAYAALLGLYLTTRGYHSFDGDQAYRLPLLLHQQDSTQFANDPFVRAIDTFNPHRAYLGLLDVSSRALGLPAALAVLFAVTFFATCLGIDRLARAFWARSGPGVGYVAIVLVLVALGGNIGTNHLFEPILRDRLLCMSLGWLGLAALIDDPQEAWRTAPLFFCVGSLIHPSLGLQLAGIAIAAAIACALLPHWTAAGRTTSFRLAGLLALAAVPGLALIAAQQGALWRGLPVSEFRLLTAYIQNPQHMIPHLWRWPQWMAFGCYPVLALLGVSPWGLTRSAHDSSAGNAGRTCWSTSRARFVLLTALVILSLGISWLAIEVVQDLRVTIFQPFRMATLARGLMLIVLAGRIEHLVRERSIVSWCRAALLTLGVTSDWPLIVATATELSYTLVSRFAPGLALGAGASVLGSGIALTVRHDTHAGFTTLTLGLLLGLVMHCVVRCFASSRCRFSLGRLCRLSGCAWIVPVTIGILPLFPCAREAIGEARWDALVRHCRFSETPTGDFERMALWCRWNTPSSARFVGPPGPKAFRLWSRRSLAFNEAGSPYHAAGLADWAARYRDHIRFEGTTATLAHLHIHARGPLELRYAERSDDEFAALARRQGASHIIRPARSDGDGIPRADGPLELLHVEGGYAVYRVRPISLASAGTG
jgi:hypothetical protein